MKPESEPISDDEWLLRRLHITDFRDGKTPLISANAFAPRIKGRDLDLNGISLYRFSCLAQPEDILATVPAEKRNLKGIVQLPVALFKSLSLTVRVDPDDRVLGHVVIPELNSQDYSQDPLRLKPILFQLADFASRPENILLRPTSNS